jgi:hypothetical protein
MCEHFGLSAAIESCCLSEDLTERIRRAISHIVAVEPAWRPLFDAPLLFASLTDTSITSRTIPAVPQHIYLGADAFRTEDVLRETIIHETSHMWLGLVTEIWGAQPSRCSWQLHSALWDPRQKRYPGAVRSLVRRSSA